MENTWLFRYVTNTGQYSIGSIEGAWLEKCLENFQERGIIKKYVKKGSDGSEGRIGRVLNGFASLSTLQTKTKASKTQKKVCGAFFWGRSPHDPGLKNFTLNGKKIRLKKRHALIFYPVAVR